jgi:fatty acid/phospholipid biosynthesis enzyme
VKGVEEVRGAAELLRAMNPPQLDFIGFVEATASAGRCGCHRH